MTIAEYLVEWDPMGFIKDLGAPNDEYSYEAADIKIKFRPSMSTKEVADMVYDVFDKQIGVQELPDFKDDCNSRAQEISDILMRG